MCLSVTESEKYKSALMLSVSRENLLKTAFNAGILNIWCYFVDITIHLRMIAMMDFKSSVYGLAGAYFEFWCWAGFWAGFIGHWAGFDWPLGWFCHTDLATLPLREISEGCSNGFVNKSSDKIQVLKRDRVRVSLSTRSYTIISKTNLQRARLHYQSCNVSNVSDASVSLLASL